MTQPLLATAVVALAEVGDKTQLLALMLAARFRRPWPIVAGILVATLANHGLAAAFGQWLGAWLSPELLRWPLGLSFLAVAVWILIPDRLEQDEDAISRRGPFLATLVLFFLAEIGDKTQVATVMLAAQFESLMMVVVATTIGMLIANAPVVWLGGRLAQRLPMKLMHRLAAALFAGLGAWTLLS
ncbi:MAG: TMEM165/GDT1 family protein [Gammaproteobacteria bacterium]|nr:TMEM165/GDT1 family protein [Gammaproteobacteria bacterium]